jgi:ATP-binding cassette, subfamily B, bacterial PglK
LCPASDRCLKEIKAYQENMNSDQTKTATFMQQVQTVYSLLSPPQKRNFWLLQGFLILASLLEVVGLTSIVPFIGVLTNPEIIDSNKYFVLLRELTGIENAKDFILILGAGTIGLVVLGNLFTIISAFVTFLFGHRVGQNWVVRLFSFYIDQDYIFHTKNNSAQLITNVTTEVGRVVQGIIIPILKANAKLFVLIVLLASLIVFNPKLSLQIIFVLGGSYSLIYWIFRRRLLAFSATISNLISRRLKHIYEGLGSIKEIKVLGNERFYIHRIDQTRIPLSNTYTFKSTIEMAPKYLIDMIVFGSFLTVTLFLYRNYAITFGKILPMVTFYALVGYRLLPSIQQIFQAIAQARGASRPLEIIANDLRQASSNHTGRPIATAMKPKSSIELSDISYTYPGTEKSVLNKISFKINTHQFIGIAGTTGSGKTTLVDILLGLLNPDEGQVIVDGEGIHNGNIREWQAALGYVPQDIFLADSSIANNIAFGVEETDIDFERLKEVIQYAQLQEFISSLQDGVHTIVGERGAQLSGGQRQRIGIARAFYHQASILILDEATSSLDSITESGVMDVLYSFKDSLTVFIIAHRITTLERCDHIFLLDEGRIADQGSHEHLAEKSKLFRKLAAKADTQ